MDHWHEKEDWLNKPLDFETIQSELWHGQRFREMSWFWDPSNEYLLPERCPHCQKIVPAAELEEQNLIFSERMRIQGWTQEHCQYLRLLLWCHAIMYEELYGLSACTENVEYSLHMPDDILCHSSLDNYWCVTCMSVKYVITNVK